MTDDMPDTAAAELALGLLEGDARAAALRRVLAEPGFAAEVERWRTRFATLVPLIPDAEAPPALLPRIEASLWSPPVATRRDTPWRWLAGASSTAAAVLLAVLLLRPADVVQPPAAPALLAAAVVPEKAGEPLSAVYDPAGGTLRLTAAALADVRHSAELWVIGGDGVPHSLALLRPGAATAIAVRAADRPRLVSAAVLAVTVEPLGGSPTGLPTGPIVAKGTLAPT